MRDLLTFLPLFKCHWRSLFWGSLLTLITLIAGIGLLSLSGWFISASAIAGLHLLTRNQFNYLVPAACVRFLSIVRIASRWGERVATHDATFRVLTSLRVTFWQKIAPLEPAWLYQKHQSDLLNRIIADIDALDHIYLRLFNPLITGFIALTCMVFLITYTHSWQLASMLGGLWLCLFLASPYFFYRLGKKPGQIYTQAQAEIRHHLLDFVTHLDLLTLFAAQQRKRKTIAQHQSRLFSAQRQLAYLSGLSQGILVGFTGLMTTTILGLILYQPQIMLNGPLDAMLIFASMASLEIFLPLASTFSHTERCQASAKRVTDILQQTPLRLFGEVNTPARLGDLRIEDVSFTYPGTANPVLNHCHLTLHPQEKVALIGHTGCGKSTLAKLLMRDIQTIDTGRIMLNGTPLADYSEKALRDSICLVSQRIDLFNDTLENNLRIAAPDASLQQLQEVLHGVQLAYLDLQERIGDGARTLSGGEKRRIGIARALLRSPALIIFDEPTEGLDITTEKEIIDCCLKIFTQQSVLFITHRLSLLHRADRILKMEHGQLQTVPKDDFQLSNPARLVNIS